MAAITSFPEIPDTIHGAYGTEITATAAADIPAGALVKINSNGTVQTATASTDKIIGVAIYNIPSGTEGAVRVSGAARVANADGSTAITAGAAVTAGALGGATAHSTGRAIGVALEPIAGGATGLVVIAPFDA